MFYQFEPLCSFPELCHGVFTRHHGSSLPPYYSLNISLDLSDDPGSVMNNRRILSESLNGGDLIFLDQVHGTDLFIPEDRKDDSEAYMRHPPRADALITGIPGKILVIQAADCQPIFIYDPVRRVTANIHAGWRGSVKNIIGKTIRTMALRFESDPKDLVACIGPSLGPCCAEFIHYQREIPPCYWKYADRSNRIDFWEISRDQLMDSGLSTHHIHISGICTRCRTDLFFSYRGEKTTGRFAAAIGLLKNEKQHHDL
ncbi:MAG: peptidoglycan editing factor PgeF [Thermodesulfobacteriota bacterium]